MSYRVVCLCPGRSAWLLAGRHDEQRDHSSHGEEAQGDSMMGSYLPSLDHFLVLVLSSNHYCYCFFSLSPVVSLGEPGYEPCNQA